MPQTLLDIGQFCLFHNIYSCHLVYQYYYTCLYSLDSRNSSYFFEPMRDAERGFNMSFPHWLPWSSNQIQIGFSTLDKLFSCQYVSKLKQRLFDFLLVGDRAAVHERIFRRNFIQFLSFNFQHKHFLFLLLLSKLMIIKK